LTSALVAYLFILTGAINIQGNREWIPQSSIEQTTVFRSAPQPIDPFIDGLITSFSGGWGENLKGTSPVLWTMGPELKGSFLVFLLLLFLRNHALRTVATAAIGLSSLSLLKGLWIATFTSGLLLSHLVHNHSLKTVISERINDSKYRHLFPLLLPIILFLVGLNYDNHLNLGELFRKITYFTASTIIVFSVLFNSTLKQIFGSRAFVWLGKISFGLYLIHLPVIYSTGFMIRKMTHSQDSVMLLWLPLLAVTVQSLGMAYLMTAWVDVSAQKISNAFAELVCRLTSKLKVS
jgi:peptidoglycan/LPS O-acetylase OafA/YrhL